MRIIVTIYDPPRTITIYDLPPNISVLEIRLAFNQEKSDKNSDNKQQ